MVTANEERILEQWVNEYADDPEFVAGELATDVIDETLNILAERKLTQTALAEKMGVSRKRVSYVFNASPNLTLLTIARIALALGVKPKVYLDSGRLLIHPLNEPFDVEELKTDYAIVSERRYGTGAADTTNIETYLSRA